MTIKILSEDTIQKIAAGEVVERPSSIIKELVENSIDANADEISVEIRSGGKSYIKVTDNGKGINKDEAELAFARHATSKINEFDDLYKIFTMGFRGEALASIVAVAKVSLFSKTVEEKTGINLNYENNKLIEKKSIAMNRGTIIEVSDLFEYIPVRKKFLSSDIAEGNKITALMYSFAIANSHISISYIRDDREIFSTNKDNSLKENLRVLFGNDYVDNILELDSKSQDYKISGFISNNMYYKGNRSMQYIFVNGRYIDNQDLVNHIESQYHSIIPNGRFPAFQLFIETDPKNIDINISPSKQKIKFNFADKLFESLKLAVTNTLLEAQKVKEIKVQEKTIKPNFFELNENDSYQTILDSYNNRKESNLINKFDLFDQDDQSEKEYDEIQKEVLEGNESSTFNIIDLDDEDIVSYEDDHSDQYIYEDSVAIESKKQINDESEINFLEDEQPYEYIATIYKKYLLFEERSTNKLLIINQTAANDRLIYDQLTESLDDKKVISTDLLSPMIVELSAKDYIKYQQNCDLFNDFGYSISEFGDNTVAIRSLPYLDGKPTDKRFFLDLLDNVKKGIDRKQLLDIFKKRAVIMSTHKAKNYSKEEAMALYYRLEKSSNKYATAHGTKISYTISLDEFERILKR